MSVFFKDDCPHCGARGVAFELKGQYQASKESNTLWDTIAICGNCSRGILATFHTPRNYSPVSILNGGTGVALELASIFPSFPSTGAPAYTPPNVAEYYRQGMENLPGSWDAAGSMFRKVLDTGLKAKFPKGEFPRIKGTLKQRIRKAAEQHELTPELAEWADKIRLDGNDAAHDEVPFSEEDARTLQTFTELVLTYLFTLPGMLWKGQGCAEEETGVDPEPSSGQPPASDPGIP